MWHKEYQDYPPDTPLIKYPVESGHGIVGCEMHEINGWGLEKHYYRRRKPFLLRVRDWFFGKKD